MWRRSEWMFEFSAQNRQHRTLGPRRRSYLCSLDESGEEDELAARENPNLRELQRISNLPSAKPIAAAADLADDFEREMEAELEGRMRESESAGVQPARAPVSQTPAADAPKTEYYDDAYFDTDEEGDEGPAKDSAPPRPQGQGVLSRLSD